MTPRPSDADRAAIAIRLIDCLREASVEVPPWHLSPRARWQLFRDTLLGHPPIRGGVRPRDMPLDRTCVRVQNLACRIQRLPEYNRDRKTLLFGHWLPLYAILRQHADEEPLSALCDCILELRTALGIRDKPLDCPFVHGLLGVLGLSLQEWKRGFKKTQEDTFFADLARWAALVTQTTSTDEPPPRTEPTIRAAWRHGLVSTMPGLHPEARANPKVLEEAEGRLSRLDAIERRLVTIKADGVQRYIDRAIGHWPMRGASAWCAQSLALARDMVIDNYDDALLFTDGDAFVSLWLPPNMPTGTVTTGFASAHRDFWTPGTDRSPAATERFPRLTEWITDAARRGEIVHEVGPAVSIRDDRIFSVLDICILKPLKEQPKQENDIPVPTPGARKGECVQVRHSTGLFTTCPPWHDDDRHEGLIGFTSVVWSLCGTTFKTHAFEGLRAAIENPDDVPKLHMPHVGQGNLLDELGMNEDSLVHLKIDGDGVGDVFRDHRYADFPRVCLELATAMRTRLVNAVRRTLDKHGELRPRHTGKTLPIDLVYLGGDDVYCCLPETLLDAFLDGFGSPEAVMTGPWAKAEYSFVAFSLPPRRHYKAPQHPGEKEAPHEVESERKRRVNLACTSVLNRALKACKKASKEYAAGGAAPAAPELIHGLDEIVSQHRVGITCSHVDARHGLTHGTRFKLSLADLRIPVDA